MTFVRETDITFGSGRKIEPMTVRLRVKGELRGHFGAETIEMTLADGSTLGDLLSALGEHWGRALPAHLWDSAAVRFRGPVVIMIDKTPVREPGTLLQDGQEIWLFKVLVGG